MKSKMKKLVSLVLAMAMVFTMSVTAFAADDTCIITIKGTTSGVTYTAYKLLDVTTDGTNYSYTVNSTYSTILSDVLTSLSVTDDAVTYLSTLSTDSDEIQAFADAVYAKISTSIGTSGTDYYTVEATDTTATLEVAYGYYLIVEGSAAATGDSVSLVMLNTAGESTIQVTTKESVPTLTKKIQDINDSTDTKTTDWQDSADYDIGDAVPYQLTATLPSTLADYDTYKLIFHDDMEDGLTFNSDSVKVYVYTYNETTTEYDSEVVESGYTVVTNCTDDCDFEVQIADVNKLMGSSGTISVSFTSKIVVEYTATLNDGAVIGNPGNWNTALLEYSNNPYASGSGDTNNTGKTPEDTVVALTYDVTINKVDGGGNAVSGATFTLEKYNVTSGKWEPKTLVTGNSGTTFSFTGLDDGWYRITETVAPSGYNKLTDPIYFVVTGTHTTTIDEYTATPLTALTYEEASSTSATAVTSASQTFSVVLKLDTANDVNTLASTNVVNKSGSVLPSTGGIGTTIFYIVGAVLVLGAGVVLVTRRRTRA